MRKAACGLAACSAAAALAACGSEETFTAEEFVQRVNDEGVALKQGEPLLSEDESKELFAIQIAPVTKLPGSAPEGAEGSMSVYDDVDGADDELDSCSAAADLLCYRAANVVLVLEGGGIEAQQLGVAVERISED